MKRILALVGSTVLALSASALFVGAQVADVPSGTWAPASEMSAARAGASAAQLADGRVLITGGLSGDIDNPSVLQTAEVFGLNGVFTPASPMGTPRAHHASVRLKDGRILVTGGETASEAKTKTAEIYDPATNAWSDAGEMLEARSGHTMSLLKSGRVLIAGGASLETYDPESGLFAFAGALSPARTGHAAAVMLDGRVVIAGGQSDTGALTAVDVYEDGVGVMALGDLDTARADLSATTMLDGRVLFAGGHYASGDLDSVEIYDPSFSSMVGTSASLSVARSGHLAFLLPSNNHVLILGGTSDGATLSSVEMYEPWSDSVRSTRPMDNARSGAVGSPLSQDGLLLAAGGLNASGLQASAELYGFPTVKTDKDDYAPGTVVVIAGSGFKPGETVHLQLLEVPELDQHLLEDVVADADGDFQTADFAPDEGDLNIRFYLTARGQESLLEAQNTFTDSIGVTAATVTISNAACSAAQTIFARGNTVCARVVVTATNGSGAGSDFFISWLDPLGNIATPPSTTETAPATTPMTFDRTFVTNGSTATGTWTVRVCKNANCNGNGNNLVQQTFTLNAAAPTISKTFGSATVPLNGSTGLSFTVTNPNTTQSLAGVAFTDGLPAGLVVATPNGLSALVGCGSGVVTATAGSGSVNLTNATLAAGASCSFSVNVTGTSAGVKNNTTGNVSSSTSGTGGTASATVTVIGPPTISKTFGTPAVVYSGSTSLSFTVTNPNSTQALTGVAFGDVLPAGLLVATPNGLSSLSGCGLGAVTATAGSGSVSLAGATVAAGASCSFSVNVTGTSVGVKNNTTGNVSSTNGGTGGTASAMLTVNPAALSITATDAHKTYGATATFAGTEFTAVGLVNGNTVASVTLTSTGAAATAGVGPYPIVASAAAGTGLGNYTITYHDGTLTVDKALISYTIGNTSHAYGSTVNLATALGTTIPTGINSQTLAITYSSVGNTTTAAVGGYAITGVLGDGTGLASNYTVTLTDGTLTVEKALISYTIGNTSHAYGSTVNLATALGTTIPTGINSETLAITYGSLGNTVTAAVGGYAITGVLGDGTGLASNYTVTLTEGTLTVEKALISYTIGNTSHAYGSTVNLATALGTTIPTGINGETLAISYSSVGNTTTAAVGGYTITGVVGDGTGLASNYTATLTDGTLTVEKALISYTIGNTSHAYGSTVNLATVLGTTIPTGINSETLAITYSSLGNTVTAAVGGYAITGVLGDGTGLASNYTVTLTDGTLTVEKALISYTIGNTSHAYGSTVNLATVLGTTIPTEINSETLAITYSSVGNTATAAVGVYAITGVVGDGTGLASNYTVTLTDGTLTVEKALISYTIGNTSHAYGSTVNLATVLGATIPTGINGETLAITYSSVGNTATAAVGGYAITGVLGDGTGLASNYTVTLTDGTLTVEKALISYTIGNTSHAYGSTVNLATVLGATIPTGINGETLAITYSSVGNTATAAVGGYAITGVLGDGTGLASNYTVTLTDGTLTVEKALISYTIGNTSHAYGSTVNLATALGTSINTGINGETLAITYSSLGNTATAAVGGYGITGVLGDGTGLASNYTVTLTDGTLTVEKALISYTIGNTSHAYGSTVNLATALGTSINTGINGETLAITYSSLGNTATAAVGGYAITGVLGDGTGLASNYTVTLTDGTLTVEKALISYTIGNTSHAYGSTVNLATVLGATIPTGINGETLAITYSSVGNTATAAVGGYAIAGVLGDGTGLASNYTVTLTDGTLTVEKALISYTIGNTSHAYGSTVNLATVLGATIPTGINGETLAITYSSLGNTATAAVGGYAITGVLGDGTGLASNYTVTLTDGTLTVEKALISYTIGNTSHAYGSTVNLATALGTSINTGINGETLAITYSSLGNTATAAVGGYAITGVLGDGTGLASNYTVTLTDGTLTVEKALISYTIGNTSHAYGSTVNLASALGTTIPTGINSETLAITYSSLGNTTTAAVGGYAITGTLGNGTGLASNYTVTLTDGTLTVEKALISYTIGNTSHAYGSTVNLATALGTSINTGINSETLAITYSSLGNTVTAAVGGYAITGVLGDGTGLASNYTVTLTDGTLTVEKALISYTIGNASHAYGSTVNLATALGTTIPTGINSETLAITYSSLGNTTTAAVGPYAITGVLADGTGLASNYTVTLTDGTLTVEKALVSYTIGNTSHAYGSTVNLATALGTTIPTGINGETLAITYSSLGNTITAAVGGYAITGVLGDGTGLASNYTVTLTDGTLTVEKALISYTIGNTSHAYGSTVNLATALGTSINTGINGETLAITYSSLGNTATAAVGGYAITGVLGDGTGLASNYTVTLTDGTLTVEKALISYTIGNTSHAYGSTVNLATALGTSINTGINGETLAITYSSLGNTATAAVGGYAITGSISNGTGLASNYTVILSNGVLMVTKAHLTVTADNKTKLLGAPLPPFTATITGFKNGETLGTSGVTGTPNFVTGATAASPIGSDYTISPSLGSLAAGNYQFVMPADFVNGTLAIVYATTGSCLGDPGHQILSPINPDGTSVFKQKSTVPAKFRVCDSTGHSIGAANVVSSFKLVGTLSGTVSAAVNEVVDSTTPDTMFRWSSSDQQWIFNINTKGLLPNVTYFYKATLNDASSIEFSFGLK